MKIMKRLMFTWLMALMLSFSVAGVGWTAPPPMLPTPLAGMQQQTCPVQHGKINKDLYVDYKGQRIYFCCKECITIFKANHEAYLEKMRQEGITPEPSPTGK